VGVKGSIVCKERALTAQSASPGHRLICAGHLLMSVHTALNISSNDKILKNSTTIPDIQLSKHRNDVNFTHQFLGFRVGRSHWEISISFITKFSKNDTK